MFASGTPISQPVLIDYCNLRIYYPIVYIASEAPLLGRKDEEVNNPRGAFIILRSGLQSLEKDF